MKNYISRRLPRRQPPGISNISALDSQAWEKIYPSIFKTPLKALTTAFSPDVSPCRKPFFVTKPKRTDEHVRWFNNLVWGIAPKSVCISKKFQGMKDILTVPNSCCPSDFHHQYDSLDQTLQTRNLDSFSINDRNHKSNTLHNDKVGQICNTVGQKSMNRYNSHLRKNGEHEWNAKKNVAIKGPYKYRTIKNIHYRTFHNSPSIHSKYNRLFTRSFHTSEAKYSESSVSEVVETTSAAKKSKNNIPWLNSYNSEAIILQPSRGEFNVRKLISKTVGSDRRWALPSGHNFVKSAGPGINDNLIEYVDQKHRIKLDSKKEINFSDDFGTHDKVKILIKKAKEKNKEYEMKRIKANAMKPKPNKNKLFRTVADAGSLKKVEGSKIKEKKVKKITLWNPNTREQLNLVKPKPTLRDEQKKILQQETLKPTPTEYQSSASYKDVFRGIFSKSYSKKESPKTTLAIFNRQSAPAIQTISYSNQMSSGNSKAMPERSGTVLKKESQKRILIPNKNSVATLKNMARTPFQKVSNSQLTTKSKASFSTVSKMPLKMAIPSRISVSQLFRKVRDENAMINKKSNVRRHLKTINRAINTGTNSKFPENNKESNKELTVTKTYYSTLGYYPLNMKGRMTDPVKLTFGNQASQPTKLEKKVILTCKSGVKPEKKYSKDVENKKSGIFIQQEFQKNSGPQFKNANKNKYTKRDEEPLKEEFKRDFHTVAASNVCDPLNEQIFTEVMSLCQGGAEKKTAKTSTKSENNKLEKNRQDYGRCTVEVKKRPPERRRGFVCRLASMLNIGCGRRGRKGCSRGCSDCGK